jgi:hypothetical protein
MTHQSVLHDVDLVAKVRAEGLAEEGADPGNLDCLNSL